MVTMTLTDARARLAEVVDHARVQREPVYLTRRNRPVAAVIGADQLTELLGRPDAVTGAPGRVDEEELARLDELSQRLSRHVKPGTPPLLDVHGYYDTRSPRL